MRENRSSFGGLSLLVSVALVVSTSCGPADEGEMTSSVCLDFASAETAGLGKVTVQQATGSGCSQQRLQIVVAEVSDLYTVSFDLVYDTALVQYEGRSTAGSILASDGAQLEVVEQQRPGRVALGISRVQTDRGVNVGPKGTVVTLEFSRVSRDAESGPLHFENGRLTGSETPPVEKPGFQWFGGVFTIR